MRVLLDTNVLVSAILFGGIPRSLLEAALRGKLTLISSSVLLAELERILVTKFDFPEALARAVRGELELVAEIAEPADVPSVVRDPDDSQVLAAAQAGGAQAIVTGDQDLLDLGQYEDVAILTPRQFNRRIRPET